MRNNEIKNDFSGLINLITDAIELPEALGISVKRYPNLGWVFGFINGGFIAEPFPVDIINTDNLCKDLRDSIIESFGEKATLGYSHGFDGSYQYLMFIDDKIIIFFPDDDYFQLWTYNQIQEDNQLKRRLNN